MAIGVCYFPEHWPRDRWERDIERMADLGFEYVRMGEFAWAQLEPERGEFRFDWLESVLDLIDDHGLGAVLCTPTATPPRWLVDDHPSILQEEADGTTREFGSRRHYCFNSEAYRLETRRIVDALADRFADHPAVAGWQIDNEFGCHGTLRCYCDDCADAFSDWLAERYGDADALNEAWGTDFWSQRYDSFDAVLPPRHTAADHHPGQLLDYYRFSSDSVVSYNELQADRLRAANDEWFITHNFMGHYEPLDTYDVCESLEFASWDSYPTGFAQQLDDPTSDELIAGRADQIGFNHDLYRSAGDGPFWVMEQQPGDINWPPYSPQPADGSVRLWAHQAVGHGADSVMYFRWRRCLEGQEQYHSGLLERDDSPGRGYDEAGTAASELSTLPTDGEVDADVALLHDYENLWATEIQPNSPDFGYFDHQQTYYEALRSYGVDVDIVHPSTELSAYSAVVAPTLYLVDDELAERLREYVAEGGQLCVSIRSGVKDRANKLLDSRPPGPFAELVGATVEEHESQHPSQTQSVTYEGETHEYHTWNERLQAPEATVIGAYDAGEPEGYPAIVRNEVGAGTVTYCGVWPSDSLARSLVKDLLDRAETPRLDEPLPETVRVSSRGEAAWVVNFGSDPVSVTTSGETERLLGDQTVDAFDCAVVDAPGTELSIDDGSA